MAWDDTKSNGPPALQASEWNAMVTDQKGHAARHAAGQADEITPASIGAMAVGATPVYHASSHATGGVDEVTINASNITIDEIGTATYDTLEEIVNGYISSGYFEGGDITDNLDGTVNVSAIKGIIKTTDSDTGANVAFDLSATEDVVLADNNVNYIYVQYNGGTPLLATSVDYSVISHTDEVIVGRTYRSGTDLYISNIGAKICNATIRDMYRIRALRRVERASGATISNPSSRYIALTASVLFSNYEKITTTAFDSSGADTWITWYRAAVSGFTQVASQTLVDNTQYDNGSGTLQNLSGNYFSNRWFYLVPSSTGNQVHMVIGQGQYNKLIDCQAEAMPSTPTIISEMGLLVGRVIVQQGTATLISVESAFVTEFSTATPSEHNELSGLDGGQAGEYYHLTSTRHTDLTDGGDSSLHYHSADRALASATGTLAVANGGTARTGYPKRSIFLSLAGGWTGTTYPDGGITTTETNAGSTPTSFNIRGTLFDATSSGDDRTHEFTAPMPENWNGGTITAIPYVIPKSTPGDGTTLVFGLRGAVIYGSETTGDLITDLSFGTAATTGFVLTTTSNGRLLKGLPTPEITLSGATPVGGALIQWKTHRAGSDTYASGATLLGWLISYTTDNYSDE